MLITTSSSTRVNPARQRVATTRYTLGLSRVLGDEKLDVLGAMLARRVLRLSVRCPRSVPRWRAGGGDVVPL